MPAPVLDEETDAEVADRGYLEPVKVARVE